MAQALTRVGLALAVLTAACGEPAAPAGPSQEARGFSLTRSRAGAVEWQLDSPRAVFNEAASRAKVETPVIGLFKAGRKDTTARALRGEIDLSTQDMDLSGSVVVVNRSDRITLKTDQLRFISSAKEFRTDQPVEIDRPEGVMRGRGLTASQDLSTIHVMHQETRTR